MIKKIAKNICAGGGAGIEFTTKDMQYNLKIIATGEMDNCKFETSGELKILSFDAYGYMDGMSDVDGEIIFSNIDCASVFEDAIETIKEEIFEYYKDNQEFQESLSNGIEFEILPYGNASLMHSAGWTRSKLTEGDQLIFESEFEISSEYSTYNYFESKIYAQISKTGEEWYQDVFEYIAEDEFDGVLHEEDCIVNYGR